MPQVFTASQSTTTCGRFWSLHLGFSCYLWPAFAPSPKRHFTLRFKTGRRHGDNNQHCTCIAGNTRQSAPVHRGSWTALGFISAIIKGLKSNYPSSHNHLELRSKATCCPNARTAVTGVPAAMWNWAWEKGYRTNFLWEKSTLPQNTNWFSFCGQSTHLTNI